MATQQTAAVQSAAQAAGIDWGKLQQFIQNMNWLQLIQFVREIIALFSAKPAPTIQAGSANLESVKAHFDAIAEMCECGKRCCGG